MNADYSGKQWLMAQFAQLDFSDVSFNLHLELIEMIAIYLQHSGFDRS